MRGRPPLHAWLGLGLLALGLAGCGKAGDLIGAPNSVFPRQYPAHEKAEAHQHPVAAAATPAAAPAPSFTPYVDAAAIQEQEMRDLSGLNSPKWNGPKGITVMSDDPMQKGLGGPGDPSSPLPPIGGAMPASPSFLPSLSPETASPDTPQ